MRTSTKVPATLLITSQFFLLLADSSINLQRLKNENQFETFSFVPWLQESFMRGFRFRSGLCSDPGETLGTRSFFSRLGLSWLQPSPDPETFYRTRMKTPGTPARVSVLQQPLKFMLPSFPCCSCVLKLKFICHLGI